MSKRYIFILIGVTGLWCILISAICLTYYRWEFRRFKASSERSDLTISTEDIFPRDMMITERPDHTTSSVMVRVKPLEDQKLKPEVPKVEDEIPWTGYTDMDALDSDLESLFSDIQFPELFAEEPVEGIDYVSPEYTISGFVDVLKLAHGDSEDVETVTESIQSAETGNVDIARHRNANINTAKAWLRILPEDDYDNRRSVMQYLEAQYELQRHVESTPTEIIRVEVITSVEPME